MREVELGWGKVLLVKDNGEFHALGHKCPHYGAPLVKGELSWCTREVDVGAPEGALTGAPSQGDCSHLSPTRPHASLAPSWALIY